MASYWIDVCVLSRVREANPPYCFNATGANMGHLRLRPERTIAKSLPRKTSKHICVTTVPQTDTGDQLE